jgi:hypothetical protein
MCLLVLSRFGNIDFYFFSFLVVVVLCEIFKFVFQDLMCGDFQWGTYAFFFYILLNLVLFKKSILYMCSQS